MIGRLPDVSGRAHITQDYAAASAEVSDKIKGPLEQVGDHDIDYSIETDAGCTIANNRAPWYMYNFGDKSGESNIVLQDYNSTSGKFHVHTKGDDGRLRFSLALQEVCQHNATLTNTTDLT